MHLVNQWGRDGNATGQGSSAAAVIITGILALVVGLGGGYASARFVSSDETAQAPASSSVPPAARDGSLYKLYQETLRQRESAMREAGDLRVRLVELQNHSGTLEAELKALRKGDDPAPNPNAAGTLARAQREHIEQLEAEMVDFRRILDETRAALAKATRQKEQAMKEAGDLKVRLTQLQSDASDLETRNQDLALHNRQTAAELADAERKIADLTSKVQAAERSADGSAANFDAQMTENSRLATENTALRLELERLQKETDKELTALRAETDRLNAALRENAAEPPAANEQPPQPQTEKPANGMAQPRDDRLVEQALRKAPGLKALGGPQRQTLHNKLVDGACVTDALEDILGRVPVLTLRSLIRDLDSPC